MRLLLVNDDEMLLDALSRHLIAQRYAVDIASDGEEAWDYIELFSYDLVVLDAILPKIDGISLCAKIRSHDYSMPVLMLSASDRCTDIIEGFNVGADDYLVKPCNFGERPRVAEGRKGTREFDELTVRIHALLRRNSQASASILKWGSLKLDLNSLKGTYDEKPLNLTAKEYALLELFLRNPNRAFSLEGIIESLWTYEDPPTEGAVRTHIKTLRQKLNGAGGEKDLVETVYGIGYRLKPLFENAQQQIESGSNSVEIANLWVQHKSAMSDRLVVLENTAIALKEGNLDRELKQEAISAAHKLSGSLGSLGFDDGSKLAREIEGMLESKNFAHPEIEPFTKLVNNLREKFDRYNPGSSLVLETSPLLLIVNNDRDFINSLAAEAQAHNFRTAIATTASQAREIIKRDRPAIVLLKIFQIASTSTQDSSIDSWDLLAQLHISLMPLLPIVLIVPETAIFNANEDFTNRLRNVYHGEHSLLVQPVTPTQAMNAVTQLMQQFGAGTKIAIVDDDLLVLQQMQASLKFWGFEITTLDNPRQFWQVLQATSPDLLVLDIEMPDINGIELCRLLRSYRNWNHLPVLFLTAHQDLETQYQAFAIGADDYVSKPVKAAELTTRILNRLSRIRTIQGR